MKHFCITLLLALVAYNAYTQNPNLHIEAYTSFLQEEHASAKDYILGLFAQYDIVILCERDHREIEVKLNNRVELTFNKHMQLIDID